MKTITKIIATAFLVLVSINTVQARPGDVTGKYMPNQIKNGKVDVKNADVAGFVIAARGKVTATNAAGSERVLTRRAKFYSNEVIKTGEKSIAQLRFKDRALMRLKPKSELNISEYHFGGAEDPKNRSIMKLVSGGFRTISGSIGKANKSAYRVNTPAASIGIRGTDYEVVISIDGMVLAAVWGGGISLENEQGSIDLGADSGFLFGQVGQGLAPETLENMPQIFAVENGEKKALTPEQQEKIKKLVNKNKGLLGQALALLGNLRPGDRATDGLRDKNEPEEVRDPPTLTPEMIANLQNGDVLLVSGKDGVLSSGKAFDNNVEEDSAGIANTESEGLSFAEFANGSISSVSTLRVRDTFPEFHENIAWGKWDTYTNESGGLIGDSGMWMAVKAFDPSALADHSGTIDLGLNGFMAKHSDTVEVNGQWGHATLNFDNHNIENGKLGFNVSPKDKLAVRGAVTIDFQGSMLNPTMISNGGLVITDTGIEKFSAATGLVTSVTAVVAQPDANGNFALGGQFGVAVPLDGSQAEIDGSFIMDQSQGTLIEPPVIQPPADLGQI